MKSTHNKVTILIIVAAIIVIGALFIGAHHYDYIVLPDGRKVYSYSVKETKNDSGEGVAYYLLDNGEMFSIDDQIQHCHGFDIHTNCWNK